MSTSAISGRVPGADGESADDSLRLFSGQRLWFSHTVPQRQWLIQNARLNGATVVDMDTKADIKLVDHARKNQAPGTHSYRYVELSIRNGRLEILADHAVGVATRVSRAVGSTTTGPKSGRIPFTEAEDQFLWNWVKPFEDNGGSYKGNEIYKQIEQANPQHTFQSWRHRWLKITRYQKRQVTSSTEEAHSLEPVDTEPAQQPGPTSPHSPRRKRRRALDESEDGQRVEYEEKRRKTIPDSTRVQDAQAATKTRSPEKSQTKRVQPAADGPDKAESVKTSQSPFGSPNVDEDLYLDLELPAPEGGWNKALGLDDDNPIESSNISAALKESTPRSIHDLEVQNAKLVEEYSYLEPPPKLQSGHSAESNNEADAEGMVDALQMDRWLALQRSLYPHVPALEPFLFRAIEATSFDFDLASEVVRTMVAQLKGMRRRTSSLVSDSEVDVVIPLDVRGVWTEMDDHLLTSSSAHDVDRVLQKHGREACNARFSFLGELLER